MILTDRSDPDNRRSFPPFKWIDLIYLLTLLIFIHFIIIIIHPKLFIFNTYYFFTYSYTFLLTFSLLTYGINRLTGVLQKKIGLIVNLMRIVFISILCIQCEVFLLAIFCPNVFLQFKPNILMIFIFFISTIILSIERLSIYDSDEERKKIIGGWSRKILLICSISLFSLIPFVNEINSWLFLRYILILNVLYAFYTYYKFDKLFKENNMQLIHILLLSLIAAITFYLLYIRNIYFTQSLYSLFLIILLVTIIINECMPLILNSTKSTIPILILAISLTPIYIFVFYNRYIQLSPDLKNMIKNIYTAAAIIIPILSFIYDRLKKLFYVEDSNKKLN